MVSVELENRRAQRKTLRARTNNKLYPTGQNHVPGLYWWEASALISAPSMLQQKLLLRSYLRFISKRTLEQLGEKTLE